MSDNIPDDLLLKPELSLDDLVKQFDTATNAQPAELAPTVPDASAHLAEVQQRNQAQWAELQEWRRQWDNKLAEQQPIIDEHERVRQREEMEAAVEETRRLNDLNDIDASLIETALLGANPERSLASLIETQQRLNESASRHDIEAAHAAVRNSTTSAPPPMRWDARKAANASDEEYEQMKRAYLARGGR